MYFQNYQLHFLAHFSVYYTKQYESLKIAHISAVFNSSEAT